MRPVCARAGQLDLEAVIGLKHAAVEADQKSIGQVCLHCSQGDGLPSVRFDCDGPRERCNGSRIVITRVGCALIHESSQTNP